MKKIILLIAIGTMSLPGISQIKLDLPDEAAKNNVKVIVDPTDKLTKKSINAIHAPLKESNLLVNETQIGASLYDLPSNNTVANRIFRYQDGTIGAVWMLGFEDPPAFPDRGTGYNYFDGVSWGPIPMVRIESFRSGWPSYAALGPNGEIIVCHDFDAKTLYFLTRETKGVGEWTESMYEYSNGPSALACPKIISTGPDHNSLHLLAVSFSPYLGQDYAMVYSRSQDGGQTWNIQNEVLDGTGSDYYTRITPDEYVWADEKDGTIAFLCFSSVWHDLFLMKSTDDGDSWEKTIIWEHPYPFYDENTILDTLFCVDGSASIALDYSGKAHVAFGIGKIWKPDPGFNITCDPYCDGIGYWNEDMNPFSSDPHALAPPGYGYANTELIEDYNYTGWMQDIDGNGTIDLNVDIFNYNETFGASTMPSLTVTDGGEIILLYSSTTETYEYGDFNYKHIFARGYCWGMWYPYIAHLTGDISHLFDECLHPVLASFSDYNIYYYYQVDGTPGYASSFSVHPHQDNRMIFAQAERWEICFGNIDVKIENDSYITISPNPFTSNTTLSYALDRTENVQFTVYNVQSQIVFSIEEKQDKGEQKVVWNAAGLPAGMYYFRIQAGERSGSGKMIKMD
jgi:hypothetical protein